MTPKQKPDRRDFLKAIAASAIVAPARAEAAVNTSRSFDSASLLAPFHAVPGDTAVKIFAPAVDGKPELSIELNPARKMFVGSAIKTFVLAEALRQADSPQVISALTAKQLYLDSSVWNLDSATFNPPNLIGMVSERTALEAMIQHSDNTGTDMTLKLAGPDNVRRFIASAGLTNTEIPDSTRVLFGYLAGAKNYKTISWDELNLAVSGPLVNSPLNPVQTMASTAGDFVSYYSRALQGAFFKEKATLAEYRRILSIGDAISLVPLPLGGSAFSKGGSIDVEGFHAVCAPGGMVFGSRWVYFAFICNWYAKAVADPDTANQFLRAVEQAMTMVKDQLA